MPKQLISLAIAVLGLLAMSLRADAHAFMVRAEPRVGSRVKKGLSEVRIWFIEPIQPTRSSVTVFDASGKQVDKKDTHSDRSNRALLCVSLRPVLEPGTYQVTWRVTSVDTHVTSGDFRFQVAP